MTFPIRTLILLITGLTFLASAAGASDVFFYPAKGQSPEQLEKDKAECYTWAKAQTGFDPMTPAPTPDTSGAAGGRRRAQKQAQAQAQADYEARLAAYNAEREKWQRAATACMEGRNYSIK